jgi:hypothetical protein
MSKSILGLMLLASASAFADSQDYFYGCQIQFSPTANNGAITAWSVEELVTKIEQQATYSWAYIGKEGVLTQDVLDLEVKDAACLKTHFGSWTCKDARDTRGYALPCNRDNLKKVIRYTR